MGRILLISLMFWAIAEAKVTVVTSYTYIADLAHEIGGENIRVSALAKPTRDPHYIVPKPSHIAKVRSADLVIVNGGELEVGWIPPLISQSGNPDIQPGAKGYEELAHSVAMIQKPEALTRAAGDVHPEGNPHFSVAVRQIPKLAAAVSDALCRVDKTHCDEYEENRDRFIFRWKEKSKEWEKHLNALRGIRVVQAHRLFDYFLQEAGIKVAAELETLPGVPPTASHLAKVIQTVRKEKIPYLITSVYFPEQAVRMVQEKTGIRVVVLPHDVGSLEGTENIFAMMDYLVKALRP